MRTLLVLNITQVVERSPIRTCKSRRRRRGGAKSSVFNMSAWAGGEVGSLGLTGQVEPEQVGDWLIRPECND